MLVSYALSQLIAHCAPTVGPVTMSAIVVYESGGRPFAIGDNTAHRSYAPPTGDAARALASRLLALGHDIDVGYAQINSGNFAAYGLDVGNAFDPCTNIATGARILSRDYARAVRNFGPGQVALVHALSSYNTGGPWGGIGYARAVYATAARMPIAERIARRGHVAFHPLHPEAP